MPGRDGTGPIGEGSMTGWGAGWCRDDSDPRYDRPRRGLGLRRGRNRMAPRDVGYDRDLSLLEDMVVQLQEKVSHLTQKQSDNQ